MGIVGIRFDKCGIRKMSLVWLLRSFFKCTLRVQQRYRSATLNGYLGKNYKNVMVPTFQMSIFNVFSVCHDY